MDRAAFSFGIGKNGPAAVFAGHAQRWNSARHQKAWFLVAKRRPVGG